MIKITDADLLAKVIADKTITNMILNAYNPVDHSSIIKLLPDSKNWEIVSATNKINESYGEICGEYDFDMAGEYWTDDRTEWNIRAPNAELRAIVNIRPSLMDDNSATIFYISDDLTYMPHGDGKEGKLQ